MSKYGTAMRKLASRRSSRAAKKFVKGKQAALARKHTETSVNSVPRAHHHIMSKVRE